MSDGYLVIRGEREEIGPVELTWWARRMGDELLLTAKVSADSHGGARVGVSVENLNFHGLRDVQELQGRDVEVKDPPSDLSGATCRIETPRHWFLSLEPRAKFGRIAQARIGIQWDGVEFSRFAPHWEKMLERGVPISARFTASLVRLEDRLKPPMSEILGMMDDRELCDSVFKRIGVWYGVLMDVAKLPIEERVVLLTWHSSGIIGNGGFQYLFEASFRGDPGFIYTAAGFRTLGCTKAAEAFEAALALFPGNAPPDDIAGRLKIYQAVPESERDRIERSFYHGDKELPAKLAAYVRANRLAFAHLP